ncbi:hypothetical protein WOLCODRAFT_140260 [Wolfiporia cocos MD-104 SS10]|uniref:Uncharacterized protein n=1 Tax=Wolfiporia cocos (strain MD-104) TaxID=742152 RepID=A0A2H3J212_WOLCO|nr:hypothetical protein WOLCODRAFT_140260 [Wolfiporia cocos MD-104 SS10]
MVHPAVHAPQIRVQGSLRDLFDDWHALDAHLKINGHQSAEYAPSSKLPHVLTTFVHIQPGEWKLSAEFASPEIKLLCKHDALFRLTITKANYTLGDTTSDRGITQPNVPLMVEAQIGYVTESDSIDSAGVILKPDFSKTQVMHVAHHSDVPESVLNLYLHEYFKRLSDGREPAFSFYVRPDSQIGRWPIEYYSNGSFGYISKVRDIDIHLVEEYFRGHWKQSNETIGHGNSPVTFKNVIKVDGEPVHFEARIGLPSVQAVCEQEVDVTFTVNLLFLRREGDDNQTLIPLHLRQKVYISLIAGIAKRYDRPAGITYLLIDAPNHVIRQQSPQLEDSNNTHERELAPFMAGFLDAFDKYVTHIIRANGCIIYASSPQTNFKIGILPDGKVNGISADVHSYGRISEITEASINALFRNRWKTGSISGLSDTRNSLFVEWKYHSLVPEVKFQPMKVRLVKGDRAMVALHIKSGIMKPSGGPLIDMKGWRLVFETNLLVQSGEDKVENSFGVCLNVDDSQLELLEESTYNRSYKRDVLGFIKAYFSAICQARLHVIHSVTSGVLVDASLHVAPVSGAEGLRVLFTEFSALPPSGSIQTSIPAISTTELLQILRSELSIFNSIVAVVDLGVSATNILSISPYELDYFKEDPAQFQWGEEDSSRSKEGLVTYKWSPRPAPSVDKTLPALSGQDNLPFNVSATCTTTNQLRIYFPRDADGVIWQVELGGEIHLSVKMNHASQEWSARSSVNWDASFQLRGGVIENVKSNGISFQEPVHTGSSNVRKLPDPRSALQTGFSGERAIDLNHILNRVQERLDVLLVRPQPSAGIADILDLQPLNQ